MTAGKGELPLRVGETGGGGRMLVPAAAPLTGRVEGPSGAGRSLTGAAAPADSLETETTETPSEAS
jgi:hypothetical protein